MDDRNLADHWADGEKIYKISNSTSTQCVVIDYITVLRPPTILCTYLLRGFWYICVLYICIVYAVWTESLGINFRI